MTFGSSTPVVEKQGASPQVALANEDSLDLAWHDAQEICPLIFPKSLPARALIKPNLCDIVGWENGVTTDPAWLKTIASQLRAIRPDVQIGVIESDAIGAYKTFRSCDETYERLGYVRAAQEEGIELINLSKSATFDIAVSGIPFPITIPELFLEEFFFISVANLKVHPYEHMTGILKNGLGLLPEANISHYHPYLPPLISVLHRLCAPDLCIIDGRVGLEGKGPIQGDPVKMNTILFGNDAVATDVVACRLMSIAPDQVPHLKQTAHDLGRGYDGFPVAGEIHPRQFAFDPQKVHPQILVKFGNRRFHRASEMFTNRWIDRFFRFKQEPVTFLFSAIPKLARRVYGRK